MLPRVFDRYEGLLTGPFNARCAPIAWPINYPAKLRPLGPAEAKISIRHFRYRP